MTTMGVKQENYDFKKSIEIAGKAAQNMPKLQKIIT